MRGVLALCLFSCASQSAQQPAPTHPQTADITLFFTTELKGTIEPCGCNSDPLGDIARTAQLIQETKKTRPVLLFDAGSSLYEEDKLPADKATQEEMRADVLLATLDRLGLAGMGLGPYDLAAGKEKVRPARLASNLPAELGVPLAVPKVHDVGGVKVGVFGVVDPTLVAGATDAAPIAKSLAEKLRRDGAQIVVALAQMNRAAARRLAREAPGIDFVIVGADVPDAGLPSPETVGATQLVTPGSKGQALARLDLHVEPGTPFTDAMGPERAAAETAKLDERITKLKSDLAGWEKDPNAEAGFMKQKRDELAGLGKERADLAANPERKPAHGSWFMLRVTPIKKRLACDAEVVKEKVAFDKAVGEANLKQAASEKAPPVEPGKAGFMGVEECAFCHKAQVEFWRGTHHAQAWKTLVDVGKQLDRDCVGCHLTGWHEPGGSTLADNAKLVDVQCEVCHGPASIHVDKDGHAPLTRRPAADMCATRCHTAEHSDTFQLEAYLRDVTGKGHGEKLRKELGDGPLAHEIRAAALEKAGKDVGANCPR